MEKTLLEYFKSTLQGKKILLGISGSIAAFKACDIVRTLRSSGAEVRVVLTQGAENFVTKTTLETLSGNAVLSGFWNSDQDLSRGTHHIETARWADLLLIAPATAQILGKLANGIADDLLSTEYLAFQGPVLIAPAMNPAMFHHPAVQANLEILRSHKVQILGPSEGATSCGEEGFGRMIEPSEIIEHVASAFYSIKNSKRIVITLGPTQSPIDPVRYITNRSSGLMGSALCWAAVQAGYEVTAICGPTEVALPRNIQTIRVQTAKEMADVALQHWATHPDIFISTAAVLDWDISNPAPMKLKKESGSPQLDLVKNPDILAMVSRLKTSNQFVLGFAAETQNAVENAVEKLKSKGCDAIFSNNVSSQQSGFESPLNGGWWITSPNQITPIETTTKVQLAKKLISLIEGAAHVHSA